MSEVQQIIKYQSKVRLHQQVARQHVCAAIIDQLKVWYRRSVCAGRISHPDPNCLLPLNHGVRFELGTAWKFSVSMRIVNAGACHVIRESVVRTSYHITVEFPLMKRGETMNACVAHRA